MNRPQTWSEIGFEVEITGDGSPSLRLSQSGVLGESMHHSGGAAEETELIYGRVIRQCFEKIKAPHFNSVGLGLGYIEMTVAREALINQDFNFTLESFETVPELKQYLICWLKNRAPSPEISLEIFTIYDHVLRCVLKNSKVKAEDVKTLLLKKWEEQKWHLHEALENQNEMAAKAHGILFDAFSAKTTPVLWTEDFLKEFFEKATAEDALISTYASRTTLKNALKAAGFQVEVREGFKGKRNSTLGSKGVFIPTSELPAETSSHTR